MCFQRSTIRPTNFRTTQSFRVILLHGISPKYPNRAKLTMRATIIERINNALLTYKLSAKFQFIITYLLANMSRYATVCFLQIYLQLCSQFNMKCWYHPTHANYINAALFQVIYSTRDRNGIQL